MLAEEPNHVYAGLLTVLLRLVFVLYAEDRRLLSTDSVYTNYYSVTGLFDRLRAEEERLAGLMASAAEKKKSRRKRSRRSQSTNDQSELF